MKVVILHQHFNTPEKGGALRSYYLARALVEHGHDPVVITANNEGFYRSTNIDGIAVHYLPVGYNNKFGFARRGISFLRYAWLSAKLVRKISGIDRVYAMSVPLTVGLSALWIKNRHNVSYLFEVGDLWPDAPVQMGFVRNFFLKKALYALEKKIYRNADSVVALSPAIATAINQKVPGTKIHLIPNMSDCDYYHPQVKNPAQEDKYNVAGKFVVAYVGAMGVSNGLDYLLECANACRKEQVAVQFLACGDGALRDRLMASAKRLGLTNLTFIDFQNREGVREILAVTDAVFVCYKNVPILETGSPNKFFDGLAAGKLIVVNSRGWIREEIEERSCGVFVDPRDPRDFLAKITPFLDQPERLLRFQQAARKLAEEKFSRKNLSSRFAEIFQSF